MRTESAAPVLAIPPATRTHDPLWRRAPRALRDRVFPSLASPGYMQLWQANVGSTMGFWMQTVAESWLVLQLTDSAFILGLLSFFRSLPMLLLAPFGGVLADRFERRRLLLTAQAVMWATTLAIGLLVAFRWIHIGHLLVAALAMGGVFSINMPARNALVSDLVPRSVLGNAVGLNSATMNASRVMGPSLAGALIGAIGIAGSYFVQVGAFSWSLVNVWRIKSPPPLRRSSGSALASLREGLAYTVRSKPIMAILVLAMSPAVFSMPMVQLLPFFVKRELAGGPDAIGYLMSSLGAGALIGSMTVVVACRYAYLGRAVLAATFGYGLLVFALAFTRSTFVAAGVLALAGFFQGIYMATNQTMLQLLVPRALRGRVIALWMVSWGLTPLGLLPLSALAQMAGAPLAISIGGALSTLVVVGVFFWRRELWQVRPDVEGREA